MTTSPAQVEKPLVAEPPTLEGPTEEELILQQCRELKQHVKTVEDSNYALYRLVARGRHAIARLRLERAMLLEYLQNHGEPIDEDQEENQAQEDERNEKEDEDMEKSEARRSKIKVPVERASCSVS